MKIETGTTHCSVGLYHLLTIGQVYAHTHYRGTRGETRYYMRLDKGLACLDNGAFIPEDAFHPASGAHKGWVFTPRPLAKLTV